MPSNLSASEALANKSQLLDHLLCRARQLCLDVLMLELCFIVAVVDTQNGENLTLEAHGI